MLSVYDQRNDILNSFDFSNVPLRHLASELMQEYGYEDNSLKVAMEQAFEMCVIMDIPIRTHFKKVYLYENGELRSDWMLSDVGSYLLLMNGDVHTPNVAKARMYMLYSKVK